MQEQDCQRQAANYNQCVRFRGYGYCQQPSCFRGPVIVSSSQTLDCQAQYNLAIKLAVARLRASVSALRTVDTTKVNIGIGSDFLRVNGERGQNLNYTFLTSTLLFRKKYVRYTNKS